MDPITISDLAQMRYTENLKISPQGDQCAFIVKSHNLSHNKYDYNIWLFQEKTKVAKQLTYSGKDSDFIWDDNDTILFSSERNENKVKWPDKKTDFYRISVSGGEASPAFSISAEVSSIQKSSEGCYIVTAIQDLNKESYANLNEEECLEEQDYHVFEEVPFWGNGRGFISRKRNALFLFEENKKELTQISSTYVDISSYTIQNNRVLYIGKEWTDVISSKDGVFLYDIVMKTTEQILEQNQYAVSNARFYQEGYLLTATDHVPYGDGQNHSFYYYDPKNKALTLLFEQTDYLGCDILSDSMGMGKTFIQDRQKLYFVLQKKADNVIYSYQPEGCLQCIYHFSGGIYDLDVYDDVIYFAANSADESSGIYRYEGGKAEKITNLNADIFVDRYVAIPEYIPFTNSDGVIIDGWILEPRDYDPSKKYPGILEIHGGPRCTYGTGFYHEMQVMASDGYFVFFCNPRGSEGYGEEFADLRGKYGTIDYNDLMEFTDHVLKQYPSIDSKRLGACGGSYGGFMCNWIEGHTDRFSAICSQRSISDWVADFGNSEIGITFDPNEMGTTPWGNVSKMWDCSPLKYANNAKTPILFIHSMQDYNCTIDQGAAMFTAMKYFGVPSRMCIFEGENHSLSRTGKPKHRMRRLREIMQWFEKYIK